eukprot:6175611-Pleurochrysis_carterae.AAC.1
MSAIHPSMYRLAIIPVHNSSEGPCFYMLARNLVRSVILKPELGVPLSTKFLIATGVQARFHAIKAAPESIRAARAFANAVRKGVGPKGPTLASNREGMTTGTPLVSDCLS